MTHTSTIITRNDPSLAAIGSKLVEAPRYHTNEMLALAEMADEGDFIDSSGWTVDQHVEYAIKTSKEQELARATSLL